ncbi:fluoride efflux transporter CrcB [Sphingomonas sp. So64.6b]|uniref:fluoride efflux transporter CrcB n=1 Tax=Sphingomonas sp. So64.6b TaxID=2997354 RepID=UPI0016043C6B|nr:fluoride efflux transporter CrcB [Sphingomonas sp. So64.6b]QNA85067.1 fluoride efflux transporter CrcB [Sphingomonas sp. So64.6b]
MNSLLLVMAGGAIGSGARFLTGRATLAWFGPSYPWGTLAVNLIGGFLMGALVGALARASGIGGAVSGENWRLLLAVGVLGGFTTFSAFSLDTVLMLQRGELSMAIIYVLASVIGSIAALFAGLALTRVVA